MRSLSDFSTIIFDCDGVILNSNKVKTDAFYHAAIPYGELAARALVEYHVNNGGISRYKKFDFFLSELVPIYSPGVDGPDLETLLENYANQVWEGLLSCEICKGLDGLRQKTPSASWFIVSGGDQSELRRLFKERSLDFYFDGIFGSPDSKELILRRGLRDQTIRRPALFFGDSKYDYYAAKEAEVDFVFLSSWSEIKDHEAWCKSEGIDSYTDLTRFSDGIDSLFGDSK